MSDRLTKPLVAMNLSQFVTQTEILCFDISDHDSGPGVDGVMPTEYVKPSWFEFFEVPEVKWVVRIHLDPDVMCDHDMNPNFIANALSPDPSHAFECIPSPISPDGMWVDIFADYAQFPLDQMRLPHDECDPEYLVAKNILVSWLMCQNIRGVENIKTLMCVKRRTDSG